MASTHEQRERPYPGRAEIRALVGGLGPTTIFDLFEECRVPEAERLRLIEEVLALVIVQGHPEEDLASWFVERLEGRCRIFAGAHEAGHHELATASGFELVGRVEYLCKASQEEVFRDPRGAVELAERAVELADRIDSVTCGKQTAAELRVLARAWLGNSLRVASNLPRADRVFRDAMRLMESVSPVGSLGGEVSKLLASLRIDQGRYQEGRHLLLEAHDLLRNREEASNAASIFIKLCLCAGYSGDAEEAVHFARRAVERAKLSNDDRLMLYARHNVADWLVEAGQAADALRRFERMQSLYDLFPADPWVQLRRRWLEGRIQAGLGNWEAAREILGEVRRDAESRGWIYDVSMVSIEIALVHLQMDQHERVLEMARDLIVFFQANQLDHHLLAAVKLLLEAAQTRSLTVGMVIDLRRFFQSSWHDPQARFVLVK